MDVLKIVENIQRLCKEKGTTPTAVGKESGAGKDLVTNMKKKGTQPSIEKIRLLADYLGVTASELLGEVITPKLQGAAQPDLVLKFNQLTPEGQKEVLAFIEFKAAQEHVEP